MALANHTALQAAVAAWLDREDLSGQIPAFIDFAEDRIVRLLRVSEMETTATAMMSGGAVALPTDFLEARRIISSSTGGYNTALEPMTPTQTGDRYPSSPGGVPQYYSIADGTITTYPSGGTGSLVMIYYARPPALATAGTNWLLTKASDLYLYGALLESAPYLGDDGRVQTWGGLFNQAIEAVQSADQRARYSSSVCRVRGETP